MNENMIYKTGIPVKISKKMVLDIMECSEDSPVYNVVSEEFNEWIDKALELVNAGFVIAYDCCEKDYGRQDLLKSEKVFFVIHTIGPGLCQLSSKLFKEGNSLGGMLIDAMADAALASLQEAVSSQLKELCQKEQLGILRRLEAGMQIPMEAQQWIWEKTKAKEYLEVGITSGYMFAPVKSTGYILVTTKDTAVFKDWHNCRACDRKDCKMRNIQKIEVTLQGTKPEVFVCEKEERILDLLIRSEKNYSFPCGGKGTCGKCKIQVLEGELAVSTEDRKFFTEEELKAGYRLACTAYPIEDCVIRFCGEDDEEFEVVAEVGNVSAEAKNVSKNVAENVPEVSENISDVSGDVYEVGSDFHKGAYGIAIDIGTTTLAISLVNSGGETLAVHTAMNPQRSFGTDVIARIQASCEGKGEALQQCIQESLVQGIDAVIQEAKASVESGIMDANEDVMNLLNIEKIAVSGNTTMGHLLMGLSCETLGVAPFTPVDISMRTLTFEQVFGCDKYKIPVLLLPGISTYVGGDIVSGILQCGMSKQEKVSVLIDLGTNGEMAIGNKDKIMVTSTAAGPAFEGGNISCGVASVAGAIKDVSIVETNVNVSTIADKSPIGVCGTGAIAMMAELLKNQWIDETGLLDDEYFDDGVLIATTESGEELTFTQKDVREMQLAIAAVRAGLETMLLQYGVTYDDVDKVYLAGGFGYKMNLEKAAVIGLLPKDMIEKVEAIGNSSLAGAVKSLMDESAVMEMERICEIAEEINLSMDKNFNEFYMEYMMFEV